ncbi:MAG: squalene/phytoene synthase family protein [Hyphomonadaceae bacterium]
MQDSLDTLVRRHDEDRWLASRFAPRKVRERLIAIYAVHGEIVRAAVHAREPHLKALRLAWWRDALARIHSGGPAEAHPALSAYASAAAGLPGETWLGVIEAEVEHNEAPWPEGEGAAQRAAAGLMQLAAYACDQRVAQGANERLACAAAAWGSLEQCRTLRGAPAEKAQSLMRARSAYSEARRQMRGFPGELFAAVGYLALAPLHLRALEHGRAGAPLLARQWKLVIAAATGRF